MLYPISRTLLLAVIALFPVITLATGDYSPVTIAGASFHKTITGSTPPLSDKGEFITLFDPVTDEFKTFGGVDISGIVGTYSYVKTGQHTAEITYNFLSKAGTPIVSVEQVVFNSPVAGESVVTVEGVVGTQTVTFSCRVPAATTPTDWSFAAWYPWAWNQSTGWEYHYPTSGGLYIYTVSTDTWELIN
ncbi:MAG: hypothetical protein ACO3ZW_03140 [Opitutales bacterium]|jgi:hypothetical protein